MNEDISQNIIQNQKKLIRAPLQVPIDNKVFNLPYCCIGCLLNKKQKINGTATFISPFLAMSCAHNFVFRDNNNQYYISFDQIYIFEEESQFNKKKINIKNVAVCHKYMQICQKLSLKRSEKENKIGLIKQKQQTLKNTYSQQQKIKLKQQIQQLNKIIESLTGNIKNLNIQNQQYDYALILVQKKIEIKKYPKILINNRWNLNVTGFIGRQLVTDNGQISKIMSYQINTDSGQSGSPVYRLKKINQIEEMIIQAIHCGTNIQINYNNGVLLNEQVIKNMILLAQQQLKAKFPQQILIRQNWDYLQNKELKKQIQKMDEQLNKIQKQKQQLFIQKNRFKKQIIRYQINHQKLNQYKMQLQQKYPQLKYKFESLEIIQYHIHPKIIHSDLINFDNYINPIAKNCICKLEINAYNNLNHKLKNYISGTLISDKYIITSDFRYFFKQQLINVKLKSIWFQQQNHQSPQYQIYPNNRYEKYISQLSKNKDHYSIQYKKLEQEASRYNFTLIKLKKSIKRQKYPIIQLPNHIQFPQLSVGGFPNVGGIDSGRLCASTLPFDLSFVGFLTYDINKGRLCVSTYPQNKTNRLAYNNFTAPRSGGGPLYYIDKNNNMQLFGIHSGECAYVQSSSLVKFKFGFLFTREILKQFQQWTKNDLKFN